MTFADHLCALEPFLVPSSFTSGVWGPVSPPSPPSPPSPRGDLVKSSPPLLICFTFHRSATRTVTHLLVPHLVATTFPSTTPLNRQINAAIKSARRLWWRSSKAAHGSAAIKGLMKSDFRRGRKSAVAVQRFGESRLLQVLNTNGPSGSNPPRRGDAKPMWAVKHRCSFLVWGRSHQLICINSKTY